jgi:hypothetical protein
MRHVGSALVGLAVAVLLTAAVFSAEMVVANRAVAAQMADCENTLNAGGGICSGWAPFGGMELPIVFAFGFVAGYVWRLRRPT